MSNKDRLLKEAARRMAKHGYNAVTMDILIEATGIAKSNVYYHFVSKEQLGIEVMEYWCTMFVEFDQSTLGHADLEAASRFSLFLSRLIHFQQAGDFPGEPIWLLASEMGDVESQRLYSRFINARLHLLHSLIHDGQRDGQFSTRLRATALSWMIIHAVSGASSQTKILHSVEPLERAAASLTSLLTDNR